MANDPFKRIDIAMGAYFRLCGVDYFNDGIGKFLSFCEENGMDADQIESELLDDPDQCLYVEALIDEFPFHLSITSQQQKEIEVQEVIKYCYKYGKTPLPKVRYPKPPQYKHTFLEHIKTIFSIIRPKDYPVVKKKNNKKKGKKGNKKKKNKVNIQIEGLEDIKHDIDTEGKTMETKQDEVKLQEFEEKKEYTDKAKAVEYFAKHFGHNGLLQICEFIIRYQMTYCLEHKGKFDEHAYTKVQKWVINQYGSIQQDLQVLEKYLLKRMIPYIPMLTALVSDTKIPASPKPIQLAVSILINNFSSEIIKAYNGQNPSAFVSIDIIGVYSKKIWDYIRKNAQNKEAETKSKGSRDIKYFMNDLYSEHIFGKVLAAIHSNIDNDRYLVRIYLQLYELEGKYPRVLVCIQDIDEMERDSFSESLYADFTSERHPIYSYPLALMRRRYKRDMMELRNALNKRSLFSTKSYDEEEFKNHSITEYMMITYVIYPIKEKDLPYIYITKLYLNFAHPDSVMRINQEDIIDILPLLFEGNLILEREQINKIKPNRHAPQFDIDIEVEKQFIQYIYSLPEPSKSPKSPKSPKSQESKPSISTSPKSTSSKSSKSNKSLKSPESASSDT